MKNNKNSKNSLVPPLSMSLPPWWAMAYFHLPSSPLKPLHRSLDQLCQLHFCVCSAHQCLFLELVQSACTCVGQCLQGPTQLEESLEGAVLGLHGSTWPEETLLGAAFRVPGPTRRLWRRRGSGPGTQVARRGPGGGVAQDQDLRSWRGPWWVGLQAQDPSRLTGAQVRGGDVGYVPLQFPNSLKVPLCPCWPPCWEWTPLSTGTSPLPQPLLRGTGPLLPPFFFPPSFPPTSYLVTWGFFPSS